MTIENNEPAPAQDTASVLSGMNGVEVTDAEREADGRLAIWARIILPAVCPGCRAVSGKVHRYVTSRPRDVRACGQDVDFYLARRRMQCAGEDCPTGTFTESVPQVPPRCAITRRLLDHAAAEVTNRGITPAEADRDAGISWPSAHGAFARAADQALAGSPAPAAQPFGVAGDAAGAARCGNAARSAGAAPAAGDAGPAVALRPGDRVSLFVPSLAHTAVSSNAHQLTTLAASRSFAHMRPSHPVIGQLQALASLMNDSASKAGKQEARCGRGAHPKLCRCHAAMSPTYYRHAEHPRRGCNQPWNAYHPHADIGGDARGGLPSDDYAVRPSACASATARSYASLDG